MLAESFPVDAHHKPVTNHVKLSTVIPTIVNRNPRARLSLSDKAPLHVPQIQPSERPVYGCPVYNPKVKAALAVREPAPAVAVTLDSASKMYRVYFSTRSGCWFCIACVWYAPVSQR